MTSHTRHDALYADPIESITSFAFNEAVANVFPDMIQRSVPGYSAIISVIGSLSQRYTQKNSYCYDLGCSLGAATAAMQKGIPHRKSRIIAADCSMPMIHRCRHHVDLSPNARTPVDLICTDIRALRIRRASIVVLNFTLQFLAIEDRLHLLARIYEGLLPGGILILSEKISLANLQQQKLHTDMHHAFKKARGYSDLEISQKRTALENVLIPETLPEHHKRLTMAGFNNHEVWFQYFNFVSICAFK